MEVATGALKAPFLDAGQIAASRAPMGPDSRLIDDGTYFAVECDGALAGCGGWSRRAMLYGGDRSPGPDAAPLDLAPRRGPYAGHVHHPAFVRRGVRRLILALCEDAARAESFDRMELVATLAGEPLYRACGYREIERFVDDRGGAGVPLLRIDKTL